MPSAGAGSSPPYRVYVLVVLTTFFWGATPVAGKLAIHDLPPLTVGVLRYGLAAALLAAAYGPQIVRTGRLSRQDVGLLVVVGILGTTFNHMLFFFALVFAPAAHGAIIAPTTSSVLTLALAARGGRERVTREQVVGVALCVAGVLLVMRPERLLAGGGRGVMLGDSLFVLSGSVWGAYSYASKLAMRRLSAGATLTLGMVAGTVVLVPFALVERPWAALASARPGAWGALLYLALACTVLSFLWWNVALHRLGAGRTAVFSNLVPVFGVLLSWLILGERMGPLQLLGAALAVLGVLVCQAIGPAARRGTRSAGTSR